MKRFLTFNRSYFILFVVLFIVEVLIALYVKDNFIRPFVGDLLVVILIYAFVKSFFRIPVWTAAFAVLIFAFCVEFLQYLSLVERLGLENNEFARTVIGTSFSWLDLVFYTLGFLVILVAENARKRLFNL